MSDTVKDQDQPSPAVERCGLRLSGRLLKNGLLVSLCLHASVLLIVSLTSASRPVQKATQPVRIILSDRHHGASEPRGAPTQGAGAKRQAVRKRSEFTRPKNTVESEVLHPDLVTSQPLAGDTSPTVSAVETPSQEGKVESNSEGELLGGSDGSAISQGGGDRATGQGYDGVVLAHIRGRQFYPQMARRHRLEGVVWVDITIRADGALLESTLSQSSGHGVLDQAALDIVARCDPFPPMPTDVSRDSMQYRVPIAFELRHNKL